MIKIAFATDDLVTISAHLGRAQKFLVYTIEDGRVTSQEERVKPAHGHGGHEEPHDHNNHGHFHNSMVDTVKDCQVVIARGMGKPAFDSIEQSGMQAIVTGMSTIEDALQAYREGSLLHYPNRVHQHH
ncbi:MAG: dinitrogenase iron-molybdenum cofactor biosynthesis protein [Anaerolineales bacterium]|nr:dinitrogenase iron-molybdenum cofactor biosynthesis protein [Anaerolineales bacterium]